MRPLRQAKRAPASPLARALASAAGRVAPRYRSIAALRSGKHGISAGSMKNSVSQ